MGQQGKFQHSLLSRTNAEVTSFRGEASAHPRLRRMRPRRRKQDGRRRVVSHSPARPEISFSLLITISTKQVLASAPPSVQLQAAADYNPAQQSITQCFSTTVFKKDANAWSQWRRFCSWLQISLDLKYIEDPIPFLQIFAKRICAGLLSAQGQPNNKDHLA